MQLPGKLCVICGETIIAKFEGHFCPVCGVPVHHRCEPERGWVFGPNQCFECVAPRQAARAWDEKHDTYYANRVLVSGRDDFRAGFWMLLRGFGYSIIGWCLWPLLLAAPFLIYDGLVLMYQGRKQVRAGRRLLGDGD